jgi:ubiquinone/menaquinone biosynthesis C-methylase UbiE
MWWMVIIALLVFLVTIAVISLSRPMKVPREPDREGAADEEALEAYDRTSRWPIFALERYIILKALNKIRPESRLIDVGCGPGYLSAQISRKFPDLKISGLDISESTVIIAKRNWPLDSYDNLEFLAGDAQRMPFSGNSVDFVVSSLSLHHWQDARMAFREIHRVLKPGGRFLIFDLRRDGPGYFYYGLKIGQALLAPGAIRRTNGAVGSFWAAYTPAELKKILDEIPVENLRIESHFGWMLIRGSKSETL